jgi:hypothetical protein
VYEIVVLQVINIFLSDSKFAGNSKRTISRIITDCQKYIPDKSSRWLALQNVKKQLEDFEPVSLKKFEIANNPS